MMIEGVLFLRVKIIHKTMVKREGDRGMEFDR